VTIHELKLKNLGIDRTQLGRIYSFVDFGNVNYWFDKDERDWEEQVLTPDQKLIVDIKKLSEFLGLFSDQKRFYYGWHPRLKRSWHIISLAEKNGFVKITKPVQFIRHGLTELELEHHDGRPVKEDLAGKFIEIPKSNFDVEISVDSIRLLDSYDTLCLLSGDSDFVHLARFLKRKGKKIIIIASGRVVHSLKEVADLYINAQQIKASIAAIKQTSPG